ncbi:sensor histidine kinase [Arthrobacter sp.]|uniref:sensor histidine kinase n=1 Tax=Arthrobacter sp. TaxID=1667 RepID=UPI0026E049F5|nr:histidine kinase [Arthrobacter sp.]MDO5752708.1 histidine kinase [Arthrobacter sp.]
MDAHEITKPRSTQLTVAAGLSAGAAVLGGSVVAAVAPERLFDLHVIEDVSQGVIWASLAVVVALSGGASVVAIAMLAVAGSAALAVSGTAWVQIAPLIGADPGLALWTGGWIWVIAITLPVTLVPILFIPASSVSVRWRRLGIVTAISGCAIAMGVGVLWPAGAPVFEVAQLVGLAIVATAALLTIGLVSSAAHSTRRLRPLLGAMLVTVPALCALLFLPEGSPFVQLLISPLIPVSIAAITLQDLIAGLRTSRQQVIEAREDERDRISDDLHDDLGPLLSAIGIHADIAALRLQTGRPDALEVIELVRSAADEALQTLRGVLADLSPIRMSGRSLESAVRRLADEMALAGVQISMQSDIEDELSDRTAMVAYRIIAESLTNAFRHAHPTCVSIELIRIDKGLRIRITHDGAGPQQPGSHGGRGLASMEKRARSLAGSLVVVFDGASTIVIAELSESADVPRS